MKRTATVAVVAATSQVYAFDTEFIRGAQTGFFLSSQADFDSYECPMATVTP